MVNRVETMRGLPAVHGLPGQVYPGRPGAKTVGKLAGLQIVRFLLSVMEKMERETGIEPATSSLGSWHSTAELLPLGVAIGTGLPRVGITLSQAQAILSEYSPASLLRQAVRAFQFADTRVRLDGGAASGTVTDADAARSHCESPGRIGVRTCAVSR